MYLAVFRCCNYSVLLIFHWLLPPFPVLADAKPLEILCLLAVRTTFFVCTNYLTVVYCNQPCIVFIYILYIFCCWVEKEPLPQSVEVLSHAAARAATFFSFWAVMRTASQVVTVRGCSVFVSILCSHTIRPRLSIFSISLRFQSYAVTQTASL